MRGRRQRMDTVVKKKGGTEERTWGRSDEERKRWYRKEKDTGRTHAQQRTKKV